MQVDISIIIPVHNGEKYLDNCIKSLIEQSYYNIEIICVDDGSKDRSKEILMRYKAQDNRLHIIHEEHNVGTSKARKDGVLRSTGKYILFVDSDDWLHKDACERLITIGEKEAADIIHFGVKVNGCHGMEQRKVEVMQKYVEPYLGNYSIDEIRVLCYEKTLLSHNLWGKLFNGNICREAFSFLTDDRFIMAEDLYAFFAITEFSKSYMGISDVLYTYNYGLGITGRNKNILELFEIYCEQSKVANSCFELCLKLNREDFYWAERIKYNLLYTCVKFMIENAKELGAYTPHVLIDSFSSQWDKDSICNMLLNLTKRSYFDRQIIEEKKWQFPFSRVKKHSKIILYGAGNIGQDYYIQIRETGYCELVAWVDRQFEKYSENEYEVQSPGKIINIPTDYIIIAVRSLKAKDEIRKYLLNLGIKGEKII